jgi:iron complex transport system permease protein
MSSLKADILALRLAAGIGLLAVTVWLCVCFGTEFYSPARVFSELIKNPETHEVSHDIIFRIRLPRVLLAALVGASLAVAGVVLQAILRNPLADPFILGISSGAGLGATLAAFLGFQFAFAGISSLGISAFAGSIFSVWLVWAVGAAAGRKKVTNLLLTGVVINAFFSAIIMFLVSISESQRVYGTMLWLMGNVSEVPFSTLLAGFSALAAAMIILQYISPRLNVMSFGAGDAETIGVNVRNVRLATFAVTGVLTSAAVSLSGLIGFAGLIVPHAVRLIFGPDHRQLIPLSAVSGAIFLMVADTFARTLVSPSQIPVGVITAILGGPVFIALLIRYSRKVTLSC